MNSLDDPRLADMRLSDLRIVHAVLREGTVTAAAKRLGVGQPTLSYALERLRARIGDPLFVRTGNRMSATPLAERLNTVALRVLGVLDDELARLATFDPATTQQEFRLGVNEMGAMAIVPKVVALLQERAPQARLAPVPGDAATLPTALESGEIELAAGHFPDVAGHLRQQLLHTRDYVCIARREHPAIGPRMTVRQFAQAPQIRMSGTPAAQAALEAELARRGLRPNYGMTSQHLASVPFIVAASDFVAVVPHGVFELFWPVAAIKLVTVPMRLPSIDIRQYWHSRMERDPANRFLRQLVYDATRDTEVVVRGRRRVL